MNQKGFSPVLIIVVILGLFALAGGACYLGTRANQPQQNQATTIPSVQNSPTTQPTQNYKQNASTTSNIL